MVSLLARLRAKAHRELLLNAGAMIGTTIITAGLGFVYWWLAARQFPQEVVGFASALISAMGLLGTLAMVGLGTLLIGELPRQPAQRNVLITTALIITTLVSGLLGALFAIIAPQISAEFHPLTNQFSDQLLFIAGVILTAVTLVLDQALIGLMRGGLQLWRNAIFALVKLLILLPTSIWLARHSGLAIYTTWTLGNLVSLAATAMLAALWGLNLRPGRPSWHLLRRLPGAALGHHALNLALQLPGLGLPVVVTVVLSAALNASFYMSWLLLHLVFAIPYTLTTVLFAAGAADQQGFTHKIRLTLTLSMTLGVVSNIVLWVGADLILGLFGPVYAAQAAWPLRIMGLAVFPLIIKDHFVAIRRVRNQITRTALVAMAGSSLELGLAALGAQLNGLTGLSLGLLLALCIQALGMVRIVYSAACYRPDPTLLHDQNVSSLERA